MEASSGINLSCIVPLIIILLVGGVLFTIGRRIIRFTDELALFGLMFNGVREVVGPQRFSIGCGMVALLALLTITLLILSVMNLSTCFGASPTEFCRYFAIGGGR